MTNDEPRIENYVEAIHAIARHQHLPPNGDRTYTEVDNPALHNKANPPRYFRIHVPAKSTENFKIIDTVHGLGLEVGDVFQLQRQRDKGQISFRVNPPKKPK